MEKQKIRTTFERRRKMIGVVVGKSADKTIKVGIEKWHVHPLYK